MTTTVSHAAALGNVSTALQALHQHLLRFQAAESGFDGTPLQLFDRARNDSAFSWLKPMLEVIVALDERRADDEPMSQAERTALLDRCRAVLSSVQSKLNDAFQADPHTAFAAGAVRKSLAALD